MYVALFMFIHISQLSIRQPRNRRLQAPYKTLTAR